MKVEENIFFILTKLQLSVQQKFKNELKPFGITPVQNAVLSCLWDTDGQTPGQLGERLFLDSSSITGILDRLEQKGLIERKPSPKDRRALQVNLTERGRDLKKPVMKAAIKANQTVLANLSNEETRIFLSTLKKIECFKSIS